MCGGWGATRSLSRSQQLRKFSRAIEGRSYKNTIKTDCDGCFGSRERQVWSSKEPLLDQVTVSSSNSFMPANGQHLRALLLRPSPVSATRY